MPYSVQCGPVPNCVCGSMAASCKKKFPSLEEKVPITADMERGRKKESIAQDFTVSPSLFSTILKSKVNIANALALGMSTQQKKLTQPTQPTHEDLDSVHMVSRETC